GRPLHGSAEQRLRPLRTQVQRDDQAQRAGHQTRQPNQELPLVRAQEGLAERNRPDAQERLQDGSRSSDQQRHQLRDRRVCPRAAGGRGFSGLGWLAQSMSRFAAIGARPRKFPREQPLYGRLSIAHLLLITAGSAVAVWLLRPSNVGENLVRAIVVL